MSSNLKLVLLALLVLVVIVGVAAIYTGGFAFMYDAIEMVGSTRGGYTSG